MLREKRIQEMQVIMARLEEESLLTEEGNQRNASGIGKTRRRDSGNLNEKSSADSRRRSSLGSYQTKP
jgi:hypothetical protein